MYEPKKNVDIMSAATGLASVTGLKYILVFYESLYIPELDHTLINPNQLHQFHTQAQDNTYHGIEQINITNPSGYFTACLEYQETNIFLNTWFPTQTDLAVFPHI